MLRSPHRSVEIGKFSAYALNRLKTRLNSEYVDKVIGTEIQLFCWICGSVIKLIIRVMYVNWRNSNVRIAISTEQSLVVHKSL